MQIIELGWVIINIGHPRTGKSYIVSETFSATKTKAIKEFVSGKGQTWRFWREKYKFRVVRSRQTISALVT